MLCPSFSHRCALMDAISTDAADLTYSDFPPILIAASSDRAIARAERVATAAGLRIGGRMPVELAAQRIEQAPLPGNCRTPDAVMGADL